MCNSRWTRNILQLILRLLAILQFFTSGNSHTPSKNTLTQLKSHWDTDFIATLVITKCLSSTPLVFSALPHTLWLNHLNSPLSQPSMLTLLWSNSSKVCNPNKVYSCSCQLVKGQWRVEQRKPSFHKHFYKRVTLNITVSSQRLQCHSSLPWVSFFACLQVSRSRWISLLYRTPAILDTVFTSDPISV